MTDKTPQQLIKLYKDMSELTLAECRQCRRPLSCCDPMYCDFAEDLAKERGVTLERVNEGPLKFMGPNGCTVPPHLRPLCTFHTCDMNSYGTRKRKAFDEPGTSEAWNKRYFDLRADIEQAEEELVTGKRIDY